MENLTTKLNEVLSNSSDLTSGLEQIINFDKMIESMGGLEKSEKSEYNIPPVDTIGRSIYPHVNKRVQSLFK